jgi:hypothetical protein
VNEFDVRLDVRTACRDIVGRERLCRHYFAKLLAEPLFNERRPFACAMPADESRRRTLLEPDQHERRISCLQGALRGFHDWAINAVTVRERSCRRERDKSSPTATTISREMLVMSTIDSPERR